MKPLRVGLLGCGDFAHKHAQIVRGLPQEVELAAFCDRNPPKTAAFREAYAPGAQTFTRHRDLFEQAQLDLVIISLPPYGHSDEVALAAQHGVHILIEKPIALTSEQAWRMVEDSQQVKTQVGFMYRFGAAVEHFKALQAQQATGGIGLMSARYFCNALHAPWWRMKDKSGGQVVEQVIHLFDLLRCFAGDPVTVYSRQANLFHRDVPDYTIEDVSATLITFASGALAVVYATNNAIPGKWISDYRVVAHWLTAEFHDANTATFTPTRMPQQPEQHIESDRDFRRALLLDLLHAIRTDSVTRIPMSEGAKSLDLVLAAARAAETLSEVRL